MQKHITVMKIGRENVVKMSWKCQHVKKKKKKEEKKHKSHSRENLIGQTYCVQYFL